jgi:putative transposase
VVTGAGVDDAAAAPELFAQLAREDFSRLEVIWADSKYHNHALAGWIEQERAAGRVAWRLEIVSRPLGSWGFVKLPRRWVAERTIAWLGRSRRLSKAYERRADSSAFQIRISAIHHLLKRLIQHKPDPAHKYRMNS